MNYILIALLEMIIKGIGTLFTSKTGARSRSGDQNSGFNFWSPDYFTTLNNRLL